MVGYVVTGTAAGIWIVGCLIYLFTYGFEPIVAGLALLGLGVFMSNIAGAIQWYDEGELP